MSLKKLIIKSQELPLAVELQGENGNPPPRLLPEGGDGSGLNQSKNCNLK